jgi:hypothetical protein
MSGRLSFAAACFIVLCHNGAAAQGWDVLTPQLNTIEFGRVNQQIIDNQQHSSNPDFVGEIAPNGSADPSFSPTYTQNKSRTRTNLRSFVENTRATDPGTADRMEALFGSTDVIDTIGAAMRGVGLNPSNAADAFAVYWVSAWQASVGEMKTASPTAYRAVAAQAARGLSQSPEFAVATDAQKQEMAEALMVQMALIDAHKEDAASNASKLKALSKAVMQGAAASGLELDKMTLTEEGFLEGSPKKRSDASDGLPDDKQALASAGGSPRGEGLSTTNMALIAAAGGAGLAGVFLFGKAMGKKG